MLKRIQCCIYLVTESKCITLQMYVMNKICIGLNQHVCIDLSGAMLAYFA